MTSLPFEARPTEVLVADNWLELGQKIDPKNNPVLMGQTGWDPFPDIAISSKKSQRFYFMANTDDKLIAIAVLFTSPENNSIETFSIHPDERNKGYGHKIMKKIAEDTLEEGKALVLDAYGPRKVQDREMDAVLAMSYVAHEKFRDLRVKYPHTEHPVTYEDIPLKPETADATADINEARCE